MRNFCLLFLLAPFLVFSSVETHLYKNLELYKPSAAYQEGYLEVSSLHKIYYAQFGNPEGIPVVVLHGGPCAGCADSWSAFFDPSIYRVIMFDQRGAGRSIPFAEMEDNTPQRSIEDMEALRNHLGVDRWLLFGGSWGSTLSLLYGEAHPELAMGFILRGVFLARQQDYEHLLYGMRATFPAEWDEMVSILPEDERGDLITAFHKRVMDPDPNVHLPAANAFMRFDTICGSARPNFPLINREVSIPLFWFSIGRAYLHYSANRFFLEENQILQNIGKIKHLPLIIVHGRYDTICRPIVAYELYKAWDDADLWFIADAGHFSDEPTLARGLRLALDAMKEKLAD